MVVIKYDYGRWADINYLYLKWKRPAPYEAISIDVENGQYVANLIFASEADAIEFKLKYG